MRIVVADAHVPFVHGGAELHVRALVDVLRHRGHDADIVALPFRAQPKEELLAQAAAWRLLDLSSSNAQPIDLLIATRFPTYFARHPRKVAWVIHQHRAAYELCGTPFSDFEHTERDVGLRKRLFELDRQMLGECRHVFANSRNTAQRLHTFNGVAAEGLYHPPPMADRLHPGPYGHYVLVVGRLERVKRADLVIRAMAHVPRSVSLVIAGDGSERPSTERTAVECGVHDRVVFKGQVDGDELVRLYSEALAVIYAPFDEDYGYVTLEAFLSRKPVVTTTDAGGPLEFVTDGVSGVIASPDPESLGAAMSKAVENTPTAKSMGDAGYERVRGITWDGAIDRLIEAAQ
jgi:glycosyltransferase involved in cell wall biosynthesis